MPVTNLFKFRGAAVCTGSQYGRHRYDTPVVQLLMVEDVLICLIQANFLWARLSRFEAALAEQSCTTRISSKAGAPRCNYHTQPVLHFFRHQHDLNSAASTRISVDREYCCLSRFEDGSCGAPGALPEAAPQHEEHENQKSPQQPGQKQFVPLKRWKSSNESRCSLGARCARTRRDTTRALTNGFSGQPSVSPAGCCRWDGRHSLTGRGEPAARAHRQGSTL